MPLKSWPANILASPPQPPPQNAIVAAYEFGPEGAIFNPSITLTLSYDPENLPKGVIGDTVTLAFWDGSKWIAVESQIDIATGKVTAQISPFSQYALLAVLPLPAIFRVTDLSVTPSEVKTGETVTIRAKIANTGGSSGSYTAVMQINGTKYDSREIAIKAGQSGEVSFTAQGQAAGKYAADVNGAAGQYLVASPVIQALPAAPTSPLPTTVAVVPVPASVTPSVTPAASSSPPPAAPTNWGLIISLFVVLVLVISGVVWFVLRRKK